MTKINIKFVKMQALGNDFIIVDEREKKIDISYSEIARRLCNRRLGIGADGLIILSSPKNNSNAYIHWDIYNGDGSKAENCVNGLRAVAKYFCKYIFYKSEIILENDSGISFAYPIAGDDGSVAAVKIAINLPILESINLTKNIISPIKFKMYNSDDEELELYSVATGNPHVVIFNDNLNVESLKLLEQRLRTIFLNGVNLHQVKNLNENNFSIVSWERGVGHTMACGSGSAASVYLAFMLGKTLPKVTVNTEGGRLFVEVNKENVYITGPAEEVFCGDIMLEI